jgi:C4-type Zn-finger protein
MICPVCGTRMNHHADKVDYSIEDAADDPVFGGALAEVHTCAHCGRVELRHANA